MLDVVLEAILTHKIIFVTTFLACVLVYYWICKHFKTKHDRNRNLSLNKDVSITTSTGIFQIREHPNLVNTNRIYLTPYKDHYSTFTYFLFNIAQYFKNPVNFVFMVICLQQIYEYRDYRSLYPLVLFSCFDSFIETRQTLRNQKTEQSINSLTCELFSNNSLSTIPVHQLKRGQQVQLSRDCIAPADILLLSSCNLVVDESPLTGERKPTNKNSCDISGDDTLVVHHHRNFGSHYNKSNIIFRGTRILSGTGRGIVIEIGHDCELYRLQTKTRKALTPLETKLTILSLKNVLLMFLLVAIFSVTVHDVLEISWLASFRRTLLLSNNLVPLSLQFFFGMGSKYLTYKIAKVQSIKTNGGFAFQTPITAIISDKTGTLTSNRIELAKIEGQFCPKMFMMLCELPMENGSVVNMDPLEYNILKKFDLKLLKNERDRIIWQDIKGNLNVLRRHKFIPFEHKTGYKYAEDDEFQYYQGTIESLQRLGLEHNVCSFDKGNLPKNAYERCIAGLRIDKTTGESHSIIYTFWDYLVNDIHTSMELVKKYDFSILSGDNKESNIQVMQSLGYTNFFILEGHVLDVNPNDIKHNVLVLHGDLLKHESKKLIDLILACKRKVVFRATPQTKQLFVELMNRYHYTCFVGDGLNDIGGLQESHLSLAVHTTENNIGHLADFVLNTWNDLPQTLKECEKARRLLTFGSYIVMEKHYMTAFSLLSMCWVSDFQELKDPSGVFFMMGLNFIAFVCFFVYLIKDSSVKKISNFWRAAVLGVFCGALSFSLFEGSMAVMVNIMLQVLYIMYMLLK